MGISVYRSGFVPTGRTVERIAPNEVRAAGFDRETGTAFDGHGVGVDQVEVVSLEAGAGYVFRSGEVVFARTTDDDALQAALALFSSARSQRSTTLIWRQYIGKAAVK